MSFNRQLGRVRRRLADYERSGRADVVLSRAAVAEASELWQAAQPASFDLATQEDHDRMVAAAHAAGWLHFMRATALPAGPEHFAALARSVVFLEPVAHDPQAIPDALRSVLGPTADAASQVQLAFLLFDQADTTTDPVPVRAAIILLTSAIAALPPDHPDRASILFHIGRSHRDAYQENGFPEDIDLAIDAFERAVAETPDDGPHWAMTLSNLGLAYGLRYEHTGVPDDLDRSIDNLELAVADAPDDANVCHNLGHAYTMRYRRGGVLADLDGAVENAEWAVRAARDDDPARHRYLVDLGNAYQSRYDRAGALADIDGAIRAAVQAIAAAGDDHPSRAVYLANLGNAHHSRYERLGMLADIDEAVEVGELAVRATPVDDPDLARCLNSLGISYRTRYEHTGSLADLDRAIDIGTQAVGTRTDRGTHAMCQSNLGISYQRRYERGGVLADLDHAITMKEQALAATPPDDPGRPRLLSNLGNAYQFRFTGSGRLADLDLAIDNLEQAVAGLPRDHPDRSMAQINLGNVYQTRYERTGESADVDRAIDNLEHALAAVPSDHPNRAGTLSNLSAPYRSRFERGGSPADLDRAIDLLEQALATTPPAHPNRVGFVLNMAGAYLSRVDAGGPGIDRDTLRTLAHQATATTAPPMERAWAGRAVGMLAHAMNEHATAVDALDAAVAVLPLVPPREAGWVDQEHRLGAHLGLVGDAVAAHCAVDDPAGAVAAAELGRGILLAAQLNSRTDLTDLDRAHPDLAARFRQVRDQLNAPDMPPDRIEDRRRWWLEHDELLTEIRRHPRFARFLLPPRMADLRPAASGGAVILVNTGLRRSDAVIITADADPILVRLPDVSPADVIANAVTLLDITGNANGLTAVLRRQRLLTGMLGWLWDGVVGPALAALPSTGDTPRVWWLPTGLFGLFPLHAAGHPGQRGALDRIVSSYTPTLRALADIRARPPATVRRQLTVALRHTPGLPDLPGTVAEATDLHAGQLGTPLLLNENATTDRVLAALPEVTWAHFACHAGTNLNIPSRSALRLHDNTLSLAEISRLRLHQAELAYLSACFTGHGGVRLADESLHLASAFHLAGFRHVIASLWPLNDDVAATAAAAFYRRLPAAPTADQAATALHQVTRDLRADHPDRPDLWAGLVHSGP